MKDAAMEDDFLMLCFQSARQDIYKIRQYMKLLRLSKKSFTMTRDVIADFDALNEVYCEFTAKIHDASDDTRKSFIADRAQFLSDNEDKILSLQQKSLDYCSALEVAVESGATYFRGYSFSDD